MVKESFSNRVYIPLKNALASSTAAAGAVLSYHRFELAFWDGPAICLRNLRQRWNSIAGMVFTTKSALPAEMVTD